jgi:fluoroquinolone transport system permease protein
MAVLRSLGPIDARSAHRDAMLRWLLFFTPCIGLGFRFAIPLVATFTESRFGFDLVPYYPLIMSFIGIAVPGMVGTVIGFLLLDQRDDDTLTALLVTPMSIGDYLRYRMVVPVVIGIPLTIVMFPLAGLTDVSAVQVITSSISAALIAPMYALFIASFAPNKVQGFALCKGMGVLAIPVLVAYFMPWPWQDIAGFVPTYWPLKVFWLFDDGAPGTAVGYAAVGCVYQALLLALLAARYTRVVHR